jgi:hypothetical protein
MLGLVRVHCVLVDKLRIPFRYRIARKVGEEVPALAGTVEPVWGTGMPVGIYKPAAGTGGSRIFCIHGFNRKCPDLKKIMGLLKRQQDLPDLRNRFR